MPTDIGLTIAEDDEMAVLFCAIEDDIISGLLTTDAGETITCG